MSSKYPRNISNIFEKFCSVLAYHKQIKERKSFAPHALNGKSILTCLSQAQMGLSTGFPTVWRIIDGRSIHRVTNERHLATGQLFVIILRNCQTKISKKDWSHLKNKNHGKSLNEHKGIFQWQIENELVFRINSIFKILLTKNFDRKIKTNFSLIVGHEGYMMLLARNLKAVMSPTFSSRSVSLRSKPSRPLRRIPTPRLFSNASLEKKIIIF